MNNNTKKDKSQALLRKLAIKKAENNFVINWLEEDLQDNKTAAALKGCATQVGITEINGITKIVRANFCRERICNVCAWRRQAKFMAQMLPVINYINTEYDTEFVLITLTIKNIERDKVKNAVDNLLSGYNKLIHNKRFKECFIGVIRSVEITYNEEKNTYHPHLHLLCATDNNYFILNYMTQLELSLLWQRLCGLQYVPIVHIEKVNNNTKGAVETLKYSLKPTQAKEALYTLYSTLKGRRLISFSGIFAKTRKLLKLSDFENLLIDDTKTKVRFNLYEFDATGGIYTFYNTFEME